MNPLEAILQAAKAAIEQSLEDHKNQQLTLAEAVQALEDAKESICEALDEL